MSGAGGTDGGVSRTTTISRTLMWTERRAHLPLCPEYVHKDLAEGEAAEVQGRKKRYSDNYAKDHIWLIRPGGSDFHPPPEQHQTCYATDRLIVFPRLTRETTYVGAGQRGARCRPRLIPSLYAAGKHSSANSFQPSSNLTQPRVQI